MEVGLKNKEFIVCPDSVDKNVKATTTDLLCSLAEAWNLW